MLKRTRIVSLLAVLLAFALVAVACGDDAEQTTTVPPATTAATTTTAAMTTTEATTTTAAATTMAAPVEDIHLALIPGLHDSFYTTFACGAQAAAEAAGGVTYSVQAADSWGLDVQQPILDAVLLQDPDGIAYVPHDFSAANPWIEARINEGIPVVTFDVIVDPPVAVQGRATDPFLGGALAASKMAESAAQDGSLAIIGISPGHGNSRRINGFLSGTFGAPGILELRPDLTVLPTVWSDNDATTAANGLAAIIEANPDLVAVYTSNGTTAQGAASAIAAAGLEDQVDVITWDLFPDFLADLESGVIDGLVGQQPYQMGVESVNTLIGIIRGEIDPDSLDRAIAVESIWVDRDNMSDPAIVQQFYVAEC
jgi:ribose transport system substrate-binding protein